MFHGTTPQIDRIHLDLRHIFVEIARDDDLRILVVEWDGIKVG